MTLTSLPHTAEMGMFVLAAICFHRWRRHRSPGAAWLALAFVTLGLTLIIGALVPDTDPGRGATAGWATRGLVCLLILFTYCLARFGAALSAGGRWADRELEHRRALADRELQLAEAQRTARLGSFTWDVGSGVVHWSEELHRLLGYEPGQVTDHRGAFMHRVHPLDRELVAAAWQASGAERASSTVEYRIVLPDGDVRWVQGRSCPLVDGEGRHLRVLGTLQDVTERKRAEEALAFQAGHDALTGLPNRSLLLESLEKALRRRETLDAGLAVLFIDIDRFKWLNDSMGHAAGDELLVAVAGRLGQALRPRDTVARVGGDEFVVVCNDVEAECDAEALAARLLAVIALPIEVAGQWLTVTASVGIAPASVPPDAAATAASLIQDADAAMYRAKEHGRDRHEVFDAATRRFAVARHETATALRRAIDNDELVVHYQPEIDLPTGTVVGVEALVRWDHPERGLLAPAEFIPVAEDTGLIVRLGARVLDVACRQVMAWQSRMGGRSEVSLSVNLAARQLLAPDLCDTVEAALVASGLEPALLCLEITESVLVGDDDSAAALAGLKALGVRIGVDDFGTGFSSLTYLKRFPLDTLKIDRSFVEGLGRSREDRAIVNRVLGLARDFGLTTIAEGVETTEQLRVLQELGCDQGQGYLWSRALPAAAADRWIAAHRAGAPAARPLELVRPVVRIAPPRAAGLG